MKALNEHWEKLLFVVILLIVLVVVGKAFTSQGDVDQFEAQGEAKDVKESALVGIPGLVEIVTLDHGKSKRVPEIHLLLLY